MSFEFDDQSLQDKASEELDGSQKLSKISYTREFLLSLSELDICKNLPRGFDQSILGEFEDTTQQRIPGPGSSPLQGFRRADYDSSPPTRGDTSNHSRVGYGKWGPRSSGQSDKDGDCPSDRDPESGRRYGNTTRRSWQSTDHDGLLGSGSFPRPSGYAAGVVAPKVRGDDHFQLKKSNEPYHPPRPYKAVPNSRREINDSLNDETFGSADCTNEDRTEEERKRRASFELMRKEQQKVLQEKHKLHVDKQKDELFTADAALLEETTEGRALERNKELDGSGTQPLSTTDSGNIVFPSHTSVPRPLVPPGFASTVLEKHSGPRALSFTKEIGKKELEEKKLHNKVQNGLLYQQEERQPIPEMVMTEKQPKEGSLHATSAVKGEMMVNPLSGLEVTSQTYGFSSTSVTNEALDDGEMIQFTKKVTMNDPVSDSNQDKSTSILETLFGSSLTANTSSNLKEPSDSKPDATQIANSVPSSKFSHWFLEDEKKLPEDITSVRPDNLLSLIVGDQQAGVQASVEATQLIPPQLTHGSSELTNRLGSSISSATTGISEQSYNSNKVEAVPAVLTCEDLEQKILSEYSEKSLSLPPPVFNNSSSDVETLQSKVSVDSNASQHLLSLLQKGANLEYSPSPNAEIELSYQSVAPDISNTVTSLDKSIEADAEPLRNSGKNVTLETIFGTAFMKELQSVEAPVSVHRSVVGSSRADYIEPHGLPFHVGNDGSRPPTIDEIKSNRINFENEILTSNSEQHTKPANVENWLGFADPQINLESLQLQNDGRLKHGLHGVVQNQLPEEESLLLVDDPLNPSKARYLPSGNSNNGELLSNTSFDIAEKLAALNAGYRDDWSLRAQEGPHLIRGPYDLTESERQYHNLHAKASPPQFHSPQMNHGRPLFRPIDPHSANMTSQVNFVAPESIKHDSRTNNQFPINMIHPPFPRQNAAPSGFDLQVHHQMLQQMQMPGNFNPPNLLHEFPRGGPVPPHPGNQPNAFMQEPNLIQRFPFGQRHPNSGGLGMPVPAALDVGGGSNNPEALRRLVSMEHGANLNKMQPFGINSQGIHNQELDMSFRYR